MLEELCFLSDNQAHHLLGGSILLILLVLALLAQVEPKDHAFHAAVERWVVEHQRPQTIQGLVGEKEADLLTMLSCERHACRQHALRELAHDRYYLTVLRGTWLKDMQIASLCEYLMTYWVCQNCNGSGMAWRSNEWGRWFSYCDRCGGQGR